MTNVIRTHALRRFSGNRSAVVGLVIVLGLFLCALFAPLLVSRPPDDQDLLARLTAPSLAEPFGTDEFGRSVLSRVLYGSRLSLLSGLVPVVSALVIGTVLGLLSGYFRGWLDTLLMRTMDVLLAFPSLLLALGIVGALGPGFKNALIAVALVEIPQYARIVRSVVLGVREEDFVQASKALGAGNTRLIVRHLLPTTLPALMVQATLGVGFAILSMAGLSFLGLGVQPPIADWGQMLSSARTYMAGNGWLLLFPGLAISLTVLGFNLLGDGLRDALGINR